MGTKNKDAITDQALADATPEWLRKLAGVYWVENQPDPDHGSFWKSGFVPICTDHAAKIIGMAAGQLLQRHSMGKSRRRYSIPALVGGNLYDPLAVIAAAVRVESKIKQEPDNAEGERHDVQPTEDPDILRSGDREDSVGVDVRSDSADH